MKSSSPPIPNDAKTLEEAGDILSGKSKKNWVARLLPFLGPAFIASVAYMDPGNFATNIQGGAQFGYMLLWVILASNLMAMLLQLLSAKLGIATGKNLAAGTRIEIELALMDSMYPPTSSASFCTDSIEAAISDTAMPRLAV